MLIARPDSKGCFLLPEEFEYSKEGGISSSVQKKKKKIGELLIF